MRSLLHTMMFGITTIAVLGLVLCYLAFSILVCLSLDAPNWMVYSYVVTQTYLAATIFCRAKDMLGRIFYEE